jgi:hypothetical protein
VAALRRLGALARRIGSVYAQIFRVYRAWWGAILLLAAAVFVPLGLLDAAALQVNVDSLDLSSGVKVFAFVAAAGAVTMTGLLGEVFFAGAIALSLTHPEGERPPGLRHLVRRISYRRLIVVDILYVVLVAVGLILLVVPGVVAFVLLGLSGPAVELEERTVRGSLARSYRLVRTDFWLVFWVLIPIELIGDAVGSFVEHLVHDALGDTFLATWISEALSNFALSPFFAIASVVLATRLIYALEGGGPRIRSLGVRPGEQLGVPA